MRGAVLTSTTSAIQEAWRLNLIVADVKALSPRDLQTYVYIL